MIGDNETRDTGNANWLINQNALGQNRSVTEPSFHRQANWQEETTYNRGDRRSYSLCPAASSTRAQMVSPSTYASGPGTVNTGGSGVHEPNTLSRFINNDPKHSHVNDNECHSHLSRHTLDLHPNISPVTYIHYAEVPTRSMGKKDEGFYVGLLGIPNPSTKQIEHKMKSIETLKNHANDWGRQYLKNEFVNISNTIMSDNDLSSVQNFKDIKKIFQTFDHTNTMHVKVMSDIQYYRWQAPYHRALWKSNMEKIYMSDNNLAYKVRTKEEVKKNTIGCLAKLFTQIKVDLTKQLQTASKRKHIADSGKQRGYVKKRKNNKNAEISLPHVNIYVRPLSIVDEMSPITFEKSISDVRELQKQNSILQQKLCDLEMRVNGPSLTFDARLGIDWNDEEIENEVSYTVLSVEDLFLLLYLLLQF
jgi:hypothetical protein